MSTLAATNLKHESSASNNIVLTSSGNVGIGTSSPNSLLELNKASGASDIRLSVAGTLYGTAYASSSDMTINSVTAIPLKLGTNNTERFQIGSSGQLGIGGANYGTSGQVLTSGGASAAPSWSTVSATGTLKNVQVFTSSGTYTRTSGVTTAVVVAVGAGGGGKGANGGGGGGNGGNGGTTSFGAHVSAGGGTGATGSNGGAGGTGGTGSTIAMQGQGGGAGMAAQGGSRIQGIGGGQGGGLAKNGSAAGTAGVRGGGSSGGAGDTGGCCATYYGGGGGGQGETAIKYTTTVGATETVTIGAGGTAGTSSTSNPGGAGGAGYIIVYEYS